jgi:23S rRNA (cytosine1962-C5)-methyltransferase
MDAKNVSHMISNAFRKREHFLNGGNTNAYRLFNGKGDGIPGLIIDRYDKYILLQMYENEIDAYINEIVHIIVRESLIKKFEITGILKKKRDEAAESQKNYMSEWVWGSAPEGRFSVMQSGIKVEVDLIYGLNTGLFLDMRTARESLVQIYKEISTILNLFCYTGVFSTHAIHHGVRRVSNVDISKTVLRRAKRNYEINEFTVDERDFIEEDAGRFLKNAAKRGNRYDLVIFDPPTFARNKQRTFSIKKDYQHYIEMIGAVSEKYILSVVNTYSIDINEYKGYHLDHWSLVSLMCESDDFTAEEDNYLKAGLWKIESR